MHVKPSAFSLSGLCFVCKNCNLKFSLSVFIDSEKTSSSPVCFYQLLFSVLDTNSTLILNYKYGTTTRQKYITRL